MQHQDLAIRFADNPNRHEINIPLSHQYRRRWWLPQLGPTATCLLNHIDHDRHADWRIHRIDELATHLGVGYRPKSLRQLNSTLTRLGRFGFAHLDVEPGDPSSPACITIYNTVRPVPAKATRHWPQLLQHNHQQALQQLQSFA